MNRFLNRCLMVAVMVLFAGPPTGFAEDKSTGTKAAKKETGVTTKATGDFDVKITPLATEDKTEGSLLGRMAIDKKYHGEIDGTGKGEMLTAGTAVKGSGVY